MGNILSYSLATSIFLVCLFPVYRYLLARAKQARFNRIILLGIYFASLSAWPIYRLTGTPTASAGALIKGNIEILPAIAALQPAGERAIPFTDILSAIYTAGLLAVGAVTIAGIIRLAVMVHGGEKLQRPDGITLVKLPAKAVPFSFMHYIFMNVADRTADNEMIIIHESTHLRCRHWLDLLLAQTVCILCWYNPVAWLLRADLRQVHEYQADEAVLASGADALKYQQLLIEKAAGVRLQSLANSLNHSNLYKRITMMYKKSDGASRRLRAFALVPAIAAAVCLISVPSVASTLKVFGTTEISQTATAEAAVAPVADKVTEKASEPQTPVQVPQFPGGEMEMLQFLMKNMSYPEEAEKAGEEGRVVVGFIVTKNGDITDIQIQRSVSESLDKEAVRVVKAMPKWVPGVDQSGQKVDCKFSLPIQFKMTSQKDTEK